MNMNETENQETSDNKENEGEWGDPIGKMSSFLESRLDNILDKIPSEKRDRALEKIVRVSEVVEMIVVPVSLGVGVGVGGAIGEPIPAVGVGAVSVFGGVVLRDLAEYMSNKKLDKNGNFINPPTEESV